MSAAVATPRPNEALCIDVSVPVTRVGVGPFSFDPLEQLLGAPLPELLAPVLVGPVTRRPSRAGPALDVYPLALPDGASLLLPLGPWGASSACATSAASSSSPCPGAWRPGCDSGSATPWCAARSRRCQATGPRGWRWLGSG